MSRYLKMTDGIYHINLIYSDSLNVVKWRDRLGLDIELAKGRGEDFTVKQGQAKSNQTCAATVAQQNTNNKIYDNTFSAHQFP